MAVLEPAAYRGYKDASEAWAAGTLGVGDWPAATGLEGFEMPEELQELWTERVAIMAADGHLPRAAAERMAWGCLQPPEEERTQGDGSAGSTL